MRDRLDETSLSIKDKEDILTSIFKKSADDLETADEREARVFEQKSLRRTALQKQEDETWDEFRERVNRGIELGEQRVESEKLQGIERIRAIQAIADEEEKAAAKKKSRTDELNEDLSITVGFLKQRSAINAASIAISGDSAKKIALGLSIEIAKLLISIQLLKKRNALMLAGGAAASAATGPLGLISGLLGIIPGFEHGGYHSGGLAIVGERNKPEVIAPLGSDKGYLINSPGPAQVYAGKMTQQMFNPTIILRPVFEGAFNMPEFTHRLSRELSNNRVSGTDTQGLG